jgi:hypothetical protein
MIDSSSVMTRSPKRDSRIPGLVHHNYSEEQTVPTFPCLKEQTHSSLHDGLPDLPPQLANVAVLQPHSYRILIGQRCPQEVIAMTQVNKFNTAEFGGRPVVESYDPWEEMFKMHYEAPKLHRSWTAPMDEMPDETSGQAATLHPIGTVVSK